MSNARRIAALLGAAAFAVALTPTAAAVASPTPAADPIHRVPCTTDTLRLDTPLDPVCFDGIGTLNVNIPGVGSVHSGTHAGRLYVGTSTLFSFQPQVHYTFRPTATITRVTIQS